MAIFSSFSYEANPYSFARCVRVCVTWNISGVLLNVKCYALTHIVRHFARGTNAAVVVWLETHYWLTRDGCDAIRLLTYTYTITRIFFLFRYGCDREAGNACLHICMYWCCFADVLGWLIGWWWFCRVFVRIALWWMFIHSFADVDLMISSLELVFVLTGIQVI